MKQRPELNEGLDVTTFRQYYYLLEECKSFCKEVGIQTSGSKLELTDNIAYYLETGELPKRKQRTTTKTTAITQELTVSSIIEESIRCSQVHRAFFQKEIGTSFKFNVAFQTWLKQHAGLTYGDAIVAYHQIQEDSKTKRTDISRQFEYNTYIRDFFDANETLTLKDAIVCWTYKKTKPGHHRYVAEDLIALQNEYIPVTPQ